jgi:hypothetical protein
VQARLEGNTDATCDNGSDAGRVVCRVRCDDGRRAGAIDDSANAGDICQRLLVLQAAGAGAGAVTSDARQSDRSIRRSGAPGTRARGRAARQPFNACPAGVSRSARASADAQWGYKAQEQPIAVHDLHATILHLLGIDHGRLTYRYNGRDLRLTDVYGDLIPQIVNT